MPSDYESSRAALCALVQPELAGPEQSRNEATTRLQMIDTLLFRCLGWDVRDCVSEERYEGKIADYSLGNPMKLAIWEAKKENVSFELPVGFNQRTCKLRTVMALDDRIAEAVRQVLVYCNERGVGLAVVCNGHQLIAFLASRYDGVPPLDGIALVFASLEEMFADFRVLWDNLSKAGTENRNPYRTLRSDTVPAPPEKLSARIPTYPGFKNRNPFQAELKNLGELFIEDIGKTPQVEEEFLRACYSTSGALSQYALVSKQILESRYSPALQSELGGESLEPVKDKDGSVTKLKADVVTAGMRRRPIILLGDVGVGKTMFLRHLLKIEAKTALERAIVLYIDFGKEPALAEQLQSFVLRKVESQLLSDYEIDVDERQFVRGVYHGELLRFARGIHSDLKKTDETAYLGKELEFLERKLTERSAHLKSCFEHLWKGHKRQIVVVLDNIDQRPIEFQEQVFLIAQSLAETWPSTVFVSLRPDTFYHSRTKGSLAAYQPRVFTVSPPRIDVVIAKRLEFALAQLAETRRLDSFPQGLFLNSESLTQYITALLQSFNQSYDLIEFLDNLSGGNVREALNFIDSFIGSGHVNAKKILNNFLIGGYTIPVHEFMRAVTYGDNEYYEPGSSPICNVFDISTDDGREHFLMLGLLGFIQRSATQADGFVRVGEVFHFAQALGFQPTQIHFSLERAAAKHLVETNPRFSDVPKSLAYRITTIGAYTLKRLVGYFTYIDAVVVDTPIVDEQIRKDIGVVELIDRRLERGTRFLEYLNQQWDKFGGANNAFDWKEIHALVSNDIQRITESRKRWQEVRTRLLDGKD